MARAADNLMHCLRALVDPARHETATDGVLLARWIAERDDRAFAGLVWRHGPLVWRIARNVLTQPEDAEDAFQATFLVLATKAASLKRRPSLAGWLYHTAHRLALKTRTAAARRLRREGELRAKTTADPMKEISAREAQTVLAEELDRLSAVYREPLLLCLYEGATHDEAARQLGCSLNTVKRRLDRGREILAQRLASRGLAPAGALALTLCAPSAAPALLVQQTITAACQFTCGHALTGAAACLAQSVLRALLLKKLAVYLMVIFTLSSITVAGGLAIAPAEIKSTAKEQEPTQVSLVRHQPEPTPAKDPPPRFDLFGDLLPPTAISRLGSIRLRHGGHVGCVAYAPDGHAIASTSMPDRFVYLWDGKTGNLLWRRGFGKDYSGNPTLAFSSDGKNLAVLTGFDFTLLDAATGKPLAEHKWPKANNQDASVRGMAIAADLNSVARVFSDSSVRLQNPYSGKETLRIKAADNGIPISMSFSSDGKLCAMVGMRSPDVTIFDTATGKNVQKLKAPQGLASVCQDTGKAWKFPGFLDKTGNEDFGCGVYHCKRDTDISGKWRRSVLFQPQIFREDLPCEWPFKNSRDWTARPSMPWC